MLTYRPVGLAALVLAPALAAATPIVVDERDRAVLLVVTPRGASPGTRTAAIVQAAGRALSARTDLSLQSVEQMGLTDPSRIRACPDQERLSCWVRTVRPDYDRLALELGNGELVPFREHLENTARRRVDYARYLVAVTVVPRSDGGDRLSTLLIDTDAALEIYHGARRDSDGWRERVENLIFENAVGSPAGFTQISDEQALARYFESILDGPFRAVFDRAGRWRPFGQILIKCKPGMTVTLDGKVVGKTAGPETRIEDVTPGQRTLSFEDPSGVFAPFETRVLVRRGETAEVMVILQLLPTTATIVARRATFWGGVGLAAVGAGIAIYAASARPRFEYHIPCVGDGCAAARQGYFVSLCDLSAQAADDCSYERRGTPAAPLGYSLLATGGAWSLGTMFIGEEWEFPWIPLVAGLVAGGASYGLSAALDR